MASKRRTGGVEKATGSFVELGTTGLKRWAGTIDEEFLRELKGVKGIKTYREMSDNDPIIGAMLYAMKHLIRSSAWTVEAASEDSVDQESAQFLRECQEDMSSTWTDVITEIQSKNVFGFSWHEVVYKRRLGDTQDPSTRSRFTDGRIGWRKMPIRAQESLYEWKFDETSGAVQAMVQQDPVKWTFIPIPIANSLLFRTTQEKGNPEGRSLLRNSYVPWFRKKNIEMFEGIGISRDLAGIPMAWVPPELLQAAAGTTAAALRVEVEKVVRNLHRDEQEGILWPLAYDDKGNKKWDLTLLTSGGQRQFDTNKIIERFERIERAIADFPKAQKGDRGDKGDRGESIEGPAGSSFLTGDGPPLFAAKAGDVYLDSLTGDTLGERLDEMGVQRTGEEGNRLRRRIASCVINRLKGNGEIVPDGAVRLVMGRAGRWITNWRVVK